MSTMDRRSSAWPAWEVMFPGTTPPWEDTPSEPNGSTAPTPDEPSAGGADGDPSANRAPHPTGVVSDVDTAVIEAAVKRLLADEHALDVIGQAIAHRIGLMPTARQIAHEVIAELRNKVEHPQ